MNAALWREMIRQAIDWVHSDEATVAALRAMERALDDAGPERAHALIDAFEAVDAAALPVEADSLHEMIDEEAAADHARLADLEVRAAYEALPAEEREALAESAREQPEVTDDAPRPALRARAGGRMRGPDSIYSSAELAAIRERTHSVAAGSWEPIRSGAIVPLARPPRAASVGTPRARAGLGARRSAGGARRTRSAGSGGGGGSGSDPDEPEPPRAEPPAPGDEHHRGTPLGARALRALTRRCLVPGCRRRRQAGSGGVCAEHRAVELAASFARGAARGGRPGWYSVRATVEAVHEAGHGQGDPGSTAGAAPPAPERSQASRPQAPR